MTAGDADGPQRTQIPGRISHNSPRAEDMGCGLCDLEAEAGLSAPTRGRPVRLEQITDPADVTRWQRAEGVA